MIIIIIVIMYLYKIYILNYNCAFKESCAIHIKIQATLSYTVSEAWNTLSGCQWKMLLIEPCLWFSQYHERLNQ